MEFQSQHFPIGAKRLAVDGDLFVIAEVGLSHDGSLGTAFAMVDAAASCGVDAVKFQTHIADEESTARERFRVRVFPQDSTRQDYWRRTAFDLEQWIELAQYTRSRGLEFLSSPFSNQAVEWLERCDVPAWKIASGELTNYPMIREMCRTGKPLLISSGMSSWAELDAVIRFIESEGAAYGIFQCHNLLSVPAPKMGAQYHPGNASAISMSDRFE